MRLVCYSFSNRGKELGDRIKALVKDQYSWDHINSREANLPIKEQIAQDFYKYDGLIFISATGIALRYIAPYIRDKKTDPAVLVIDDMGKFVISLLSGHLGGANALSQYLAGLIQATPVITTATDNRGIEALDLYSQRKNYHMLDMTSIKTITGLMVDGKKIGIYSPYLEDVNYGNLIRLDSLEDLPQDLEGLIIVSNRILPKLPNLPYTILVPRNINLGLGCKKGVEASRILKAIRTSLRDQGIYEEALGAMATVEVKKDEEGLLEASRILKLPLKIFTIEELKKVEDKFTGSDFVKKTIGVASVSEPCAYLLGAKMLVLKSIHNGITVSISEGGRNE